MSKEKEKKREKLGEGRVEVGDRASSARHTPHPTGTASDDSIQNDSGSVEEIPVLPANASGEDKVTTSEQDQPIDEESMYDRRPDQDKDRPPSRRADG